MVCRSDLQLRIRPPGYVCDRCADRHWATVPLGIFGRIGRVFVLTARALRGRGQRGT
jgi:hypothetical protein